MVLQIFSIFDTKIGSFAQPWFSQTVESGKRMFLDAASDPATTLYKHPQDFALFHLGEFDDESAVFRQEQPINLGLLASFRAKE